MTIRRCTIPSKYPLLMIECLAVNQKTANRFLIALGWTFFLGALVSWPLASFWFAKNEPQTILALSEIALIGTGAVLLLQAYTKKDIDS